MSKVTRHLKKQATRAELAARNSADAARAEELKRLATAFRAQATVIKDKKKKKARPA